MSIQPQILGKDEMPNGAVRSTTQQRFLSDSGVYAKLAEAIDSFAKEHWDHADDAADTLVQLPIPHAFDEEIDEDEATQIRLPAVPTPVALVCAADAIPDLLGDVPTLVKHPRIDEEPVLLEAESAPDSSPEPVVSPQRAPGYFKVALQVRGEELARLWRREGSALAGRTFVWSHHDQSWVGLHNTHQALQSYREPFGARRVVADVVRLAGDLQEAVVSQFSRRGHWFSAGLGAAATLLVVLGYSLVTHTEAPVVVKASESEPIAHDIVTAPATAGRALPEQVQTSVASEHDQQAAIVPVTSLPLVNNVQPGEGRARLPIIPVSELPLGSTQSVTLALSSEAPEIKRSETVAAPVTFNVARARQVLEHASGRMQRCAGDAISGSAIITFAPSGTVDHVSVESIAGDVSKMSCVVSAFRSVRIPAFAGDTVAVRKSFGTTRS